MTGSRREQHRRDDGGQRRRRYRRDEQHAPPRQAVADVVRHEMPDQDRQRRQKDEAAVRRTAEEVHARHPIERPGEQRRVTAQHVEQRDHQHGAQQGASAPPQAAAGDAKPEQQHDRHGADEQVVERFIDRRHLRHRLVVRSPGRKLV
jgi:hypothetical protein